MPERLPPTFVDPILRAAAKNELAVSAFSCWELALLVSAGRIELAVAIDDFIRISEEESKVQIVDVDARIAIESNRLPGEIHRDPADRLIVATARVLYATLATVDEKLLAYPHVRTWPA